MVKDSLTYTIFLRQFVFELPATATHVAVFALRHRMVPILMRKYSYAGLIGSSYMALTLFIFVGVSQPFILVSLGYWCMCMPKAEKRSSRPTA
jgi:hypothetical protein